MPEEARTTRTVIDVDDRMPAEAAGIFGTTTKVATVNAAPSDRGRTPFILFGHSKCGTHRTR